jgi:hypothetical protein
MQAKLKFFLERYTTELKFILAYNFAGQVTRLWVMAGPTIKTWHLMMMI